MSAAEELYRRWCNLQRFTWPAHPETPGAITPPEASREAQRASAGTGVTSAPSTPGAAGAADATGASRANPFEGSHAARTSPTGATQTYKAELDAVTEELRNTVRGIEWDVDDLEHTLRSHPLHLLAYTAYYSRHLLSILFIP